MKNFFLIFMVILGLTKILEAQTVSTERIPLITKITATWCNPCGTWGWSLNEEIMTQNPEALTICLHASTTSQLYDPAAATIYSVFNPQSSGVPSWYVDGIRKTQYSTNGGIYTTQTRNAVKAATDSILVNDAQAGTGFLWSWNGNTLNITAKAEFFVPSNGEYYLGVYVIEDDIVKYQNGIGNNAVHHPTFRKAVSAEIGDLLTNGNVTSGQSFTKNYAFNTPIDYVKSKMRLMGIVWKIENGVLVIVNTSVSDYLQQTPTSKNNGLNFQLELYPNPTQNYQFTIKNLTQNEKISVFDILGKNISVKQKIINDEIIIQLPENTPKGIYIVQVTKDNKTYTQKLIVD